MLTPYRRALLALALVVVLGTLYLWLALTGRQAQDVLPWLAIAIPQLLVLLRGEIGAEKTANIEEKVNGNFHRATVTADTALAALPPREAKDVIRSVDRQLAPPPG